MYFGELYLWGEGKDDTRLLEALRKKLPLRVFKQIHIREYKRMPKDELCAAIKSHKECGDSYYLFTDHNGSQCYTEARDKVISIYPEVERERIFVVKKKIEGWYLAGINHASARKLGLTLPLLDSNAIGKRAFSDMIPRRYSSEIDFNTEILKNYDIVVASSNNHSFGYMITKLHGLSQL